MVDETLVRMPKLADTLVEGTVARWLKQPGDAVAAGEPLVQIETDKVSTELNAPASGVLLAQAVGEGQTVPIETVIARIGSGEGATAGAPPPAGPEASADGTPSAPAHGERARVTPIARRLLEEHGLSPAQVGKGDGSRVTKQDVLGYVNRRAALAEKAPGAALTPTPRERPRTEAPVARPPAGFAQKERGSGPAGSGSSQREASAASHGVEAGVDDGGRPYTLEPLSSMRRAIAEHMTRARATIPHGQTVVEADLDALSAWREREKEAFRARTGAGLTYTVLFVSALGRALGRMAPALDLPLPSVDGKPAVNLGVAVAIESGLIVPVVRNADRLSLEETARAIKDLAERARGRTLGLDETQGAIMTVTNVGSFGNLTASPIVPLGQLGILGPGIVQRRPVALADGGIGLGWRCLVGLTFDRRAFSDLAADRFLGAVIEELSASRLVF